MVGAESPAVSVLVPVYNVEGYLRQCLESLRDQSFADIEVICINDGSTDSSPEIIRSFIDEDARFLMIDKENSGYGSSMNQGLSKARGDYIAILESDDFFEPDAIERLYRAAKEHDADVVKANFYLHWSKPKVRDDVYEFVTEDIAGLTDPREHPDVFFRKSSIWSGLYRKAFLDGHAIAFLETPGASYQDTGFNFKVYACADKAVFIRDCILHYRQDNESSSVNSPKKAYCICDEYDEISRFLVRGRCGGKRIESIKCKTMFYNYLWNYDRLSGELKLDFLMRMARDFLEEHEKGNIDYSLFNQWEQTDLRFIMESPEAYHRGISAGGSFSRKWFNAKRYYKVGGLRMVAELVKRKVART